MKTIEYHVSFNGVRRVHGTGWVVEPTVESIIVQARDINSGFTKALKRAREPLGSGVERELLSIAFWAVV